MDERSLTELARTQHGLVSRAQAHDAGVSDTMVRRRIQSGRWTRLRAGVYVLGGAPPSWHQDVLGSCLAGGADVVASHRTAARLWDLVDADGRIEVTVATDRRVRLPRTRVHESILLPALDRTARCAIPVTTLPRTLADVCSHQDPATVGIWIDQAIRHHRLDLLDLRSCLARLTGPGRRDLHPLRQALSIRLPGYDPGGSELEAKALRALHDAGLPAPVQQHPVRRPDGTIARIDLAYPAERLAIELDGWDQHGRRAAFDADRIRRNELTLLGWTVLQFTWSMPDRTLVATVAATLDRAQRRAS